MGSLLCVTANESMLIHMRCPDRFRFSLPPYSCDYLASWEGMITPRVPLHTCSDVLLRRFSESSVLCPAASLFLCLSLPPFLAVLPPDLINPQVTTSQVNWVTGFKFSWCWNQYELASQPDWADCVENGGGASCSPDYPPPAPPSSPVGPPSPAPPPAGSSPSPAPPVSDCTAVNWNKCPLPVLTNASRCERQSAAALQASSWAPPCKWVAWK